MYRLRAGVAKYSMREWRRDCRWKERNKDVYIIMQHFKTVLD